MKNLKKLISVIIAVIMIVGSFATVSAADYKDVESTNSFYKAIKVLSGLGIVNGDDEGNFNPDNDIKRSEMVALVCRAMGEEDIATASASNAFTDVAANHWAAGYIAWGVNRGIINGMGDGTFAPDASVSYQDSVVMIMRALGYDRIAQRAENGGYPTGYLKLASQYGVLKDAGYDNQAAAPRKVVAQLIYNALTAPLVDVSYYGVNVEDDRYVIYNGKNGTALRTLLTFSNEVYKVKAEITATPKASSTLIDKAGNYMVTLDITDDYDYEGVVEAKLNDPTLYVGETEAADLLGATVEAYIAESEELNDYVLLAVVSDGKTIVEETVTADCLGYAKPAGKDYFVFKYMADAKDTRATEIEVKGDARYYHNGVEITGTAIDEDSEKLALVNAADSITFSGAKNDRYSRVFVTEYTYKQVKEVNVDEEIIKFAPAGTLDLNVESRDEKFFYNVFDAAGKEISLEDIAEGDILNIVAPGNDLDAITYLDIYVSNETVEGRIDEILTTGEYVINDEAYDKEGSVSLAIGNEGIFYLTIDGKIFAKDAASTISKNFAIVAAIEKDTDFGVASYTVRLFTADGKFVDYPVASTLKYAENEDEFVSYKSSGTYLQSAILDSDSTFGVGAVSNTTSDAVGGSSATDDAKNTAKAAAITSAQTNAAKRLVTYKINANGELSEMRNYTDNAGEIGLIGSGSASYNKDFDELGGETIGNAPMFVLKFESVEVDTTNHKYLAVVDDDNTEIANTAAIKDEASITAWRYQVKDETELAAILTLTAPSSELETTPLAVVSAVGTALNDNEDVATSITFVQSGEVKKLLVSDICTGDDAMLAVGDVFQYEVNEAGEIKNVKVLFDAFYSADEDGTDDRLDGDESTAGLDLESYATGLHSATSGDREVIFGLVTEFGDYIELASALNTTTGEATTFKKYKYAEVDGATYALYDYNLVNNAVKALSYGNIKYTTRPTNAYAAICIVNDDARVEDIVEIKLPETVTTWSAVNAYGAWDINLD